MADIRLTNGAIARAMRDEEVENPVFQILGFKKIAGQAGADRFRLHISDGTNSHSFAMLATQLNHLVQENALENYAVIRVDKMICNTLNNKRIMIILQLDVIAKGTDVGVKLGTPIPWQENDTASPTPPASTTNSSSALKTEPTNTFSSSKFYGNSASDNKSASSARNGANNFASKSTNKAQGDGGPMNVIPIQDINPYVNKVAIRARVTNKGDVRTWSNSRGEGKLFSMDLLDESGEIRLTAFNQSVEHFYDMIEVNRVYYFNKFTIKNANKNFTSIPHDYELSISAETTITPDTTDAKDIPKIDFRFVPIDKIVEIEKDKLIDVLGICKKFSDVQAFTSKAGKDLKKRDLTLVDQTNTEINLTIWGKAAEDFNDDGQPVIAVKGAKVSDFGGRSLTVFNSTMLQLNPDVEEAHNLRGWYDNGGSMMESQSISGVSKGAGGGGGAQWKLLREANGAEHIDQEKGDYFMAKVTLMAIRKENVLYKACANDTCNKKVVDQNNGLFRCEKCNTDHPTFKWRLMVSADFADFSDHVWATSFQETGEVLLGHKTDALGAMSQSDPEELQAVLSEAQFTDYIVKFRAKMETYNGETRKKFTVVELTKVNYAEYSKKLLAELKETAS